MRKHLIQTVENLAAVVRALERVLHLLVLSQAAAVREFLVAGGHRTHIEFLAVTTGRRPGFLCGPGGSLDGRGGNVCLQAGDSVRIGSNVIFSDKVAGIRRLPNILQRIRCSCASCLLVARGRERARAVSARGVRNADSTNYGDKTGRLKVRRSSNAEMALATLES